MRNFDEQNEGFKAMLQRSQSKLALIKSRLDGKSKTFRPTPREVRTLKRQLLAA